MWFDFIFIWIFPLHTCKFVYCIYHGHRYFQHSAFVTTHITYRFYTVPLRSGQGCESYTFLGFSFLFGTYMWKCINGDSIVQILIRRAFSLSLTKYEIYLYKKKKIEFFFPFSSTTKQSKVREWNHVVYLYRKVKKNCMYVWIGEIQFLYCKNVVNEDEDIINYKPNVQRLLWKKKTRELDSKATRNADNIQLSYLYLVPYVYMSCPNGPHTHTQFVMGINSK